MIMTVISPEAPKILADFDDEKENVLMNDYLAGRLISMPTDQAKELWNALDKLFNVYYTQEG